jgi:hypothetical protein
MKSVENDVKRSLNVNREKVWTVQIERWSKWAYLPIGYGGHSYTPK